VEFRHSARQLADDFLASRTDLGSVLRWIEANRKSIYASQDAEARELVDRLRQTVQAVLHGRIEHTQARDHLRNLMQSGSRPDSDWAGGPSRRFT
jgi:hypothetical protein